VVSAAEQKALVAWWRWPLVPLAALAGAFAGAIVAGGALLAAAFWLLGFNERSWLYLYLLPAASGLVFGHMLVRITYRVAPSSKLGTGAVMVTLLGLYSVFTVGVALSIPTVGVRLPAAALAAFLAAGISLITVARRPGLGPNNSSKPTPLRGAA
jgi:hypothetical protein